MNKAKGDKQKEDQKTNVQVTKASSQPKQKLVVAKTEPAVARTNRAISVTLPKAPTQTSKDKRAPQITSAARRKTSTGNGRVPKNSAPRKSEQPANATQAISPQDSKISSKSTWEDKVLKIRKAISILFMLTDAPANTFSPTASSPSRSERTAASIPHFSFAMEKNVVEDFIFLSSTTTDPLKVRALCLERIVDHANEKFCIRVAANHGDLTSLKKGLENIISSLKHQLPEDGRHSWDLSAPTTAAAPMADSRMDGLLRSIVTLNLNRVLCRLQSRHARWEGNFKKNKAARTPFPIQLFEIYDRGRSNQIMNEKLKADLETLRILFSALESEDSTRVVRGPLSIINTITNIVKVIYCLWRRPDYCATISNQQLKRQLAKCARYVTTTFSLCDLRRKHSWIGLLTVELVRLDIFNLPPLVETSGCFRSSVSQLSVAQDAVQAIPGRVRRLKDQPRMRPDQTFVSLVNTKCAVHAEIQLMFYYELSERVQAPRIILSTKRPCFLCALVFAIHGRYHMPTSHGRLYEKWTFPDDLKKLIATKQNTITELLEKVLGALSACITDAVVNRSGAGRLASSESLFRKSMVWARASRAPSLDYIAERDLVDTRSTVGCSRSHIAKLAQLRASTSMLVTNCIDLFRLARGRSVIFQLDSRRTGQVGIRTEHLWVLFSSDNVAGQSKITVEQDQPMLFKLWCAVVRGPSQEIPKHVVDVACLRPGEEAVINQKQRLPIEFGIKHKEDYLLAQISSLKSAMSSPRDHSH